MYRILCGVCFAVGATFTSVADAQFVRVGPFGGVSIRAPFVAIDAVPGGGARVRAPFTAVDTGVYGYGPVRSYRYGYRTPSVYGPAYSVPVYPTPSYPQVVRPESSYPSAKPAVPSDQLPQYLKAAALQLKRSLSLRRSDSDVWLNYLDPDRIIAAVDSGQSPPSLGELLRNYDGVVGNAGLASIRAAAGFADTHQLLRQYVDSNAAPTASAPVNEPSLAPAATEPVVAEPDAPVPAPPAEDPAPPAENDGPEELPIPTPL